MTKEDIDKVRDIEGFPIGSDEDIIALSDAPYYTACPNPFIEEFIKEHGTPYDELHDKSVDYPSVYEAIEAVKKSGGLVFLPHLFIYKWADNIYDLIVLNTLSS